MRVDSQHVPARFTRAVQHHDALVDGCYLGSDRAILPRQHIAPGLTPDSIQQK
jgi:hypothetical protein